MSEFFFMNGDGAYVWSAYGLTLVVVMVNVWLARAKHRTALQRARELAAQTEVPRRQPTVRRLQ
jgi:heme exporter protein CcmD